MDLNLKNAIINGIAGFFGVDIYKLGYINGLKKSREIINREIKRKEREF